MRQMQNQQTDKTLNYHSRTKHSYESIRRNAHFLDWPNRPSPFKTYRDLEPIPLPPEREVAGVPAAVDLGSLRDLLYYAAGVTKRRQYPGGEILFRAAACTGALYEIELYVVCADLPDLAAGVYHFHPGDMALRCLRQGDFRAEVDVATEAPALIVSTGTYWHNAWKYQARTYRHFGWDNGTIHANLLAMAGALGLRARVMCGFVDSDVNRLLGLDVDREVALAIVAIGDRCPARFVPEMEPVQLATLPLSKYEVDYPVMREMHQSTWLESTQEVSAWRDKARRFEQPEEPAAQGIHLEPVTASDPIKEVIHRRGSSRRFRRDPITFQQFSTVLVRSRPPILADFPSINDIYLIVNSVNGLTPGAYFLDARRFTLVPLKCGDFRARVTYLALGQDLAGDAAASVFFMADLEHCLDSMGNRGYRAVQFEAGILGGRMYLAAYAQRLGATGLTFFDDDVTEFFSPHAANKSAVFLVAIGHPVAIDSTSTRKGT
jgi:SagB-type dehydrogenase family enzyme